MAGTDDQWLRLDFDVDTALAAYTIEGRAQDCCVAADSPHAWEVQVADAKAGPWTTVDTVKSQTGCATPRTHA